MLVPVNPKIYHIVHIDRLARIIADGYLWSDAKIVQCSQCGTTIGMNKIKKRRLNELTLTSHPHLYVGDCVPFYFCPRSIMLYLIFKANHPELDYRDGQRPIIHLEADLYETVAWAEKNNRCWAFTLSNAGSYYFEDRNDLKQLDEIDWRAVQAINWSDCKEDKQAEFLIEKMFPWELVTKIGVYSHRIYNQVKRNLLATNYKPRVEIKSDWYY